MNLLRNIDNRHLVWDNNSATSALRGELIGHDEAQMARDMFIVNLCSVAALTWVVYDMILCFGKEVSLVWGRWHERKGRHSRRIYLLVRYLSVMNLAWYVGVNTAFDLTLDFCKAWHYIVVVNATVITLLPDAMILIRVNAVYNWNVTTLLFTISLFFIAHLLSTSLILSSFNAAQMATSLSIGTLAVSSADAIVSPGFPMPGCVLSASTQHSKITLAAWIPSIAAQCVYFVLMLNTLLHVMKGLDKKGKATWESLFEVRKLVPTMVIFIRHGFCYFIFGLLAKVVNTILIVTASGPLKAIGISWLMALYPVLVTRIYLDMVEYLHTRKRSHAHLMHAGEPGTLNAGENRRFSYNSLEPPHGLGQITFAAPSRSARTSLSLSMSISQSPVEFRDEEF